MGVGVPELLGDELQVGLISGGPGGFAVVDSGVVSFEGPFCGEEFAAWFTAMEVALVELLGGNAGDGVGLV